MAFPEKITNREYKIAGAFTFVIGAFFLVESLGLLKEKTPEPIALIALSALPVLFGLVSLLTKPIRSVLILGPVSLFAVVAISFVLTVTRDGLSESYVQQTLQVGLVICIWAFLKYVRKKVWASPEADGPEPTDPTPPEDE